MNDSDYQKIAEHLDAASRVLASHQGELLEGDIRIRQLLSLTATETRRQIAEIRRSRPTDLNAAAESASAP